eukprot:13238774-Heterocapsa_arctica.AAC.1
MHHNNCPSVEDRTVQSSTKSISRILRARDVEPERSQVTKQLDCHKLPAADMESLAATSSADRCGHHTCIVASVQGTRANLIGEGESGL